MTNRLNLIKAGSFVELKIESGLKASFCCFTLFCVRHMLLVILNFTDDCSNLQAAKFSTHKIMVTFHPPTPPYTDVCDKASSFQFFQLKEYNLGMEYKKSVLTEFSYNLEVFQSLM